MVKMTPTNCSPHWQHQLHAMCPTPNQRWLMLSSVLSPLPCHEYPAPTPWLQVWAPSSPPSPFFNTRTRCCIMDGDVATKRWWWTTSFSTSTLISDLQPQAWALISLLLHFLTLISGATLLMVSHDVVIKQQQWILFVSMPTQPPLWALMIPSPLSFLIPEPGATQWGHPCPSQVCSPQPEWGGYLDC